MAAIVVVVDGSNGGIEPMAPMAALSTVAAVDGGGNNGVSTTTSYEHNRPLPSLGQGSDGGVEGAP
jgi:hypothetical protein